MHAVGILSLICMSVEVLDEGIKVVFLGGLPC
jgi:hypothetical protein